MFVTLALCQRKKPGVKPKIEVKLPPETIKRQKITVTEIRIVSISRFILGRGDGTWTHDLLVPNQARYQTALHLVQNSIIYYTWFLKKVKRFLRFFQKFLIKFVPSFNFLFQRLFRTAPKGRRVRWKGSAAATFLRKEPDFFCELLTDFFGCGNLLPYRLTFP